VLVVLLDKTVVLGENVGTFVLKLKKGLVAAAY
jgi:hypothetical protein